MGGRLGWLEVVPGHSKAIRDDRSKNGPKNLQILRFRRFLAKLGSLERPYLGPETSKLETVDRFRKFGVLTKF